MLEAKSLADSPVAELSKQDLATAILIALLPLNFRSAHIDTPFLEKWYRQHEFLLANFLILVDFDAVKGKPVLVVLPEILQQVPVLLFTDVVFTKIAC